MASQKMATVEITCNTKRATERLNEYVGLARKKINELAILNDSLNEKRRLGLEITKQEIVRQKQLENEIKELNTAQTRGIDDMKKAREVLKDLANSSIKEVNKAIRDMTKEMNGLRDVKGIRKVQQDIEKLRTSLDEKMKVSITELTGSLKNLNNISTDKLRQNLVAIRKEMEHEPEDTQWARYLKNAERATQAQIAINEYGQIGKAPATGSLRSEDRLRAEAERSRLISAYQTVSQSGDAAHQAWANQALQQIQQYNSALDALTDKERKEAKAKADQAAEAKREQDARNTLVKLYNGEKASIQELTQAQKQFKAEIERTKGFQMTDADQQHLEALEHHLERINQMLNEVSQADIDKVFADFDSQSLETLEATLKKVKENASQIKVGDTAGIDKAAQQMDVLEKKIAEVKARMTEYNQLAERGMDAHKTLANIENASYEDLDNTLKFLEERHKKLQGTETKRQQQSIANQDKIRKRMKELRGDLLSEEEIRKRVAQTGKYSATQLQQAYDSLKVKLMSLRSEETEAIRETRKQMKLLQKEIDGVQGKVSGLTKIWTTAVRNIGAYVGVFAGFNYVKGKLEEVIKKNYELSDSLTNVRKVSGLTMDDINQLYTNISKIDTRNTINTLTDLAYQGGKLGIQEYGGVEALTGFVTAAEQVQAALGEDLGEDALPALAKLTENMGLIKSMGVEEAMQKTASAIFALSTSSVSTGTGIVDFSKRLMPVAKSAGVATSELLGLASATESSGLAAEVASTAFVKMFPSIYKNADALEKYLGMAPGVIREMYDQNRAMDAMVMIFDKMQDMGNLNKYPEIFKLLGSEGARMNTVMSAMANNVDMLRTHLNTSNKAFEEGTAVINEYNLQTNSAAGILERANNIWEKAFVNPEGVDMVKELAEAWYLLSKHVATSDTWMTALRTSLKSIETIVATLIYLLPALIRVMAFYGIVNTVKYIKTNFWDMRKAILAAAGAQGKLNAAMRANAFSIVISLGFTLVSLFWDLYKIIEKDASATKKLSQEEKDLADAEKMVADNTKKEVGHLNALYKAATDTLQPMEKRMQWVQQLKKEFPDYFKDLTDEAILTGKAADKYEALAQSLMKAAKARAYQQKMDQISEESVKLQEEIDNDLDYLNQNQKKYKTEKQKQQQRDDITTYGGAVFAGEAARQGATKKLDAFVDKYEETENRVLQKQAQIAQNDERIRKLAEKAMENTPTPKTNAFQPGSVEEEGGGSGSGSGTKELNAEYRDEQAKAKGLIDNIKNYYQRQMNAVRQLANETDMSEGDIQVRIDRLTEHMNNALANARKAIGGEKNEWEAFKAKMREDLYEQTDKDGYNFSENLLDSIMDNQLDELRKMILVLSEKLNKQGNVLLDQILRKATENEGSNISYAEQQRRKLEKEILEKNYTGKVDRDTITTLEKFDIGGLTAQQDKNLMEWSRKGDVDSTKAFVEQRLEMWQNALANSRKNFIALLDADASTEAGQDSVMRLLFGDNYQEALTGSALEGILNMSEEKWKVFYQKLIDHNDNWTNAQKKGYDEQKKLLDFRFGNRPDIMSIDTQISTAADTKKMNDFTGESQGSNFSRLAGFTATPVKEDPEMMMYDLKLQKAQLYYEEMQRLRDQDLVSEQMLLDAKQQMVDAENTIAEAVFARINDNISKLSEWMQPIEQFGADVGDAMGKAVFESESMADGMRNALQSLVRSWGESTIQIVKNLMMQQLKQKLIGKTMVKDKKDTEGQMTDTVEEGEKNRFNVTSALETGAANIMQQVGDKALATKQTQDTAQNQAEASKAQGSVLAGIAEGAAKIIGMLGPFGAPLIAVITALLMGLLNTALAALTGGGSDKGNNANQTNRKIKLASGMLTYDKGNVQQTVGSQWRGKNGEYITDERRTVVGDDGRVYRAKEQRSLPEGVSMVTEPIATRVNGQQALVGERGPEIVIGRKTTRAIQMNRPDLLRDLAMIDRGITTRKVRTFDEGNISDMATAFAGQLPAPQQSADRQQGGSDSQRERDRAMLATLGVLSQTIGELQQQLAAGIHAELNMYGENGVYKKLQKADKYYKKYGG